MGSAQRCGRRLCCRGMDELTQIAALVKDGGTILLLTVAILGGMRGWYVWKREHDAAVAERDEWKTLALELLRQNDRSTSTLEKLANG